MSDKQNVGKDGEELATKYLEDENYKILDVNFSSRNGEIDIIARDNLTKEIVFVEVKTRTNLKYGKPIDAVDKNKIKHILNTAQYYMYIKKIEKCCVRFDVIEIYVIGEKIKLVHTKNVEMCM